MPAKRLSMRKIKEVLRLQARGMSNRKIAVCCGTSRSAVAEYLRRAAKAGLAWPLPPGLSDTPIEQRLFPPPPTRATRDQTLPDWQWVNHELKHKGVTQFLLWQEYLELHPHGYQYSWFWSDLTTDPSESCRDAERICSPHWTSPRCGLYRPVLTPMLSGKKYGYISITTWSSNGITTRYRIN